MDSDDIVSLSRGLSMMVGLIFAWKKDNLEILQVRK